MPSRDGDPLYKTDRGEQQPSPSLFNDGRVLFTWAHAGMLTGPATPLHSGSAQTWKTEPILGETKFSRVGTGCCVRSSYAESRRHCNQPQPISKHFSLKACKAALRILTLATLRARQIETSDNFVAFMCFSRPPNKTSAEGCRAKFEMGSEQTAANRVLFAAHNYDNKKQLSPGASNSNPDVQGRLGS